MHGSPLIRLLCMLCTPLPLLLCMLCTLLLLLLCMLCMLCNLLLLLLLWRWSHLLRLQGHHKELGAGSRSCGSAGQGGLPFRLVAHAALFGARVPAAVTRAAPLRPTLCHWFPSSTPFLNTCDWRAKSNLPHQSVLQNVDKRALLISIVYYKGCTHGSLRGPPKLRPVPFLEQEPLGTGGFPRQLRTGLGAHTG